MMTAAKRQTRHNKHAEVSGVSREAGSVDQDWVVSRLDEKTMLPPIYRLKLPDVRVKSTLIRWLWLLGYEVKVISKGLDIRYQQVRNIITTEPKRAAREDLPPLEIEFLEAEDIVDMLLGEALERDFLAARKQANVNIDEEEGE